MTMVFMTLIEAIISVMFIADHWFRYSLLYSVLGFFTTTLLEPYSKSKTPTRFSLLTVHRLALNARVQLKVWLDPLFLSSSCSSKSRRKRILVSQQLSSHPPQNIFSLSTLVQGQLLSFFHSITGFFFFFNHCRFIYHLKWAYGFQFSFFQKWRMTCPPYDNLSFQMFRSSSTTFMKKYCQKKFTFNQ